MIPTTSAILTWMTKVSDAEDLERDAVERCLEEDPDVRREIESKGGREGDRDDRPEQPRS